MPPRKQSVMPNTKTAISHAGRAAAIASVLATSALAGSAFASSAIASAPPIAEHFGFADQRILRVDDNCGPIAVGDFNADRRPDLVVVNNRKSRIELHLLRASQRTAAETRRDFATNELPPNPWYDRVELSVRHRVGAIAVADVNNDDRPDIVYAGADPQELVVMLQTSPATFELASRRLVRELSASSDSLAVGDVDGDGQPEIITVAGGRAEVFAVDPDGVIGEPTSYSSRNTLRTVHLADLNGDDRLDLLGFAAGTDTPIRLWLGETDGLARREHRFPAPALTELRPIHRPGDERALLASITAESRQIALDELATIPVEAARGGAEREVAAEVMGFVGGDAPSRQVVLADLDGDGSDELLALDPGGNAIIVHRQTDTGYDAGTSSPTLKSPAGLDIGPWAGGEQRVFVLSTEEAAVGASSIDRAGNVGFPSLLRLATAGGEPVAIRHVSLPGSALAVVVKDRRDFVLEIHRPASEVGGTPPAPAVIELDALRREPAAILSVDADRDGLIDLLLLTPGQPLVMVRSVAGGENANVLSEDSMPQFGLVRAAAPGNTAIADLDGDGTSELLIADDNFVRSVVFDAEAGWSVPTQINLPDRGASLSSLAFIADGDGSGASSSNGEIVVGDPALGRLVRLAREGDSWSVVDRIRLLGFDIGELRDGPNGIMVLGSDGFATVRLGGERLALERVAVHRPEAENRREHTIAAGDINGDGFTDLAVLDAVEQMVSVLSISRARRLVPAMEFKVFESRLFRGGDGRQFEPSMAIVTDVTGNGAQDLVLLVHDRVLVYPQATQIRSQAGGAR